MIRLATPTDAADILEIYAPYVENTSITFETEVPSVVEFAERIRSYTEKHPWLVYEVHGKIAGYAYASRHRERTAYQWSVEASVYIDNDHMRSGLATVLYTKLFNLLRVQGFTNVYAVINLPNDRSVAFHERMGFNYFATYEKVGYKLGQWKNVGWWALQLNEYSNDPKPPRKLSDLNKEEIKQLIAI